MTSRAGLPDDPQAKLSAYLDGVLDAAARAEVEAWLERSPEARSALAEMRRLEASLRSLPVPEPGEAYWQRFADRVEARLATNPEPESLYERLTGWLFRGGSVAWLRAGGALAMLTLVAVLALRGVRAPMHSMTPDAAPQAAAPAPAPAESDVAARVRDMAKSAPPATEAGPSEPATSLDAAPSVDAALDTRRDSLDPALRAPAPVPAAPDVAALTADTAASAPPLLEAGPPEVATFVDAALDGRRDAALAALVQIEGSQPGSTEVASMRAWIDATSPASSQREERANPAGRATLDVMSQSAAEAVPSPELQALQALDALVWPRRAADTAAAERLALQLETLASADTAARALARRYLTWLGEASPDSAAARTWRQRLRALDG